MRGPLSGGDEVGDRYRIDSFLGEGGMQFVYRAYDLVLERVVALKAPKDKFAEKRFKGSAILAARVNHPNVAKTLDYVEDDVGPFLVEEFVDGGDLARVILSRVKYLDPYMVAKLLHHMAKGLAASHHSCVIHRDLKPTNVLIGGGISATAVKITDFGIARMAEEEIREAAEGQGGLTNTTSQTAIGALPYMAPEVITSPTKVSFSADIWSLGAMAFEMLTGRKPFGAGLQAVAKILSEEAVDFPRQLEGNQQFSPLVVDLKAIIDSCLVREVDGRPTADELIKQCERFCYPVTERFEGTLKKMIGRNRGFIDCGGETIFFHMDSVFGPRPKVGDSVAFAKFPGSPRARAHPVLLLSSDD